LNQKLYPVLRNIVVGLLAGLGAVLALLFGLNAYFSGYGGGIAWIVAAKDGVIPENVERVRLEGRLCYAKLRFERTLPCDSLLPDTDSGKVNGLRPAGYDLFAFDDEKQDTLTVFGTVLELKSIRQAIANQKETGREVDGFFLLDARLLHVYSESKDARVLVRDVTNLLTRRIKINGALEAELLTSTGQGIASTWRSEDGAMLQPSKGSSWMNWLVDDYDVTTPAFLASPNRPDAGVRSIELSAPYEGYAAQGFSEGSRTLWTFASARALPGFDGQPTVYVVISVPGEVMMYYPLAFFWVSVLFTFVLLFGTLSILRWVFKRHLAPIVTLAAYIEELGVRIAGGVHSVTEVERIPLETRTQEVTRLRDAMVQLEEKLLETIELEQSLREARRLESLGRLAGGVAHEFNNLLNIIIVNCSFLKDDSTNPLVLRSVSDIEVASEQAVALTGDLLKFARRERDDHDQSCDVSTVAKYTLNMLQRSLGASVYLTFEVEELESCGISGTEFQQILINLVFNAKDAVRGGEGHVQVRMFPSEDPQYLSPEGPAVVLEVEDNGTGIDAKTLESIFDPFFSTKDSGSGTGLGLSIVKEIIHQVGASIEVESTPEVGTVFRVHLPRVKQASPVGPKRAEKSIKGLHVLLVEDDLQVGRTLMQVLQRNGVHVYNFQEAQRALEWLSGEGNHPDVVVADVLMPNMNGQELGFAIRKKLPAIPILFVSGFSPNGTLDPSFPMSAFRSKPVGPQALVAAISDLWERHEPPGGSHARG
jgi:signal transduction histidine kinase